MADIIARGIGKKNKDDIATLTSNLAEKANGNLYRDSTATNPASINLIQGYSGNAVASDLGQCIINGGGALGRENVIGGNIANVNTANPNNEPMTQGTGANLSRILGGYDNVINGLTGSINGDHCSIGSLATHGAINGGAIHKILDNTDFAAIGGGINNTISGDYGVIAGGSANTVSGNVSAVGGGSSNTASGINSTIAGGATNTASGQNATIGGGNTNIAGGTSSTVAGGHHCQTTKNYSTIGGGFENVINGEYATIPGGSYNQADGYYSHVSGLEGLSKYQGENVHSMGKFATKGDSQKSELILRKKTLDGVETYVSTDNGTTTLNIPDNGTWGFTCKIVGRRVDIQGESAMFEIKGLAQRIGTGASALVGTPTVTEIGKSAAALWTVRAQCVGNGVYFKVTGETGKTINWVAQLDVIQAVG